MSEKKIIVIGAGPAHVAAHLADLGAEVVNVEEVKDRGITINPPIELPNLEIHRIAEHQTPFESLQKNHKRYKKKTK